MTAARALGKGHVGRALRGYARARNGTLPPCARVGRLRRSRVRAKVEYRLSPHASCPQGRSLSRTPFALLALLRGDFRSGGSLLFGRHISSGPGSPEHDSGLDRGLQTDVQFQDLGLRRHGPRTVERHSAGHRWLPDAPRPHLQLPYLVWASCQRDPQQRVHLLPLFELLRASRLGAWALGSHLGLAGLLGASVHELHRHRCRWGRLRMAKRATHNQLWIGRRQYRPTGRVSVSDLLRPRPPSDPQAPLDQAAPPAPRRPDPHPPSQARAPAGPQALHELVGDGTGPWLG